MVALRLEGRLPDQQLVQQHANAPPVHAEAGAAALQHLRRLSKGREAVCTMVVLSSPILSAATWSTVPWVRMLDCLQRLACCTMAVLNRGIWEVGATAMPAPHLVLGRAADGVGPPVGDVLRKAKVRDLDVAGSVHQQVLGLQVLQCQEDKGWDPYLQPFSALNTLS